MRILKHIDADAFDLESKFNNGDNTRNSVDFTAPSWEDCWLMVDKIVWYPM